MTHCKEESSAGMKGTSSLVATNLHHLVQLLRSSSVLSAEMEIFAVESFWHVHRVSHNRSQDFYDSQHAKARKLPLAQLSSFLANEKRLQ